MIQYIPPPQRSFPEYVGGKYFLVVYRYVNGELQQVVVSLN